MRFIQLACIAAFAVAALVFSYFRIFEVYELQTYDWRCSLRGARPVSDDVVLVEIADDSLAKIGQWPFDRAYHAALIEALRVAGAKAVIFDILFVEPSESDKDVVEMAKNAGNVYFSLAMGSPIPKNGQIYSEAELATLLPEYAQVAKRVGSINAWADVDGKRRRIPLLIHSGDKTIYQVSFLAALDKLGIESSDVKLVPGRELDAAGQLSLPLDEQGLFIVNYAGKWAEAFKHYSYVDIIYSLAALSKGEKPILDLGLFKGKICFVGFTATASHDANATPLEPIYPNVGIHANVLNSILNKDFIYRCGRPVDLLILILLGGLVFWISANNKPFKALLFCLAIIALFAAGVCFAFISAGIWVDLFYPVLVSILIYAGMTFGRVLFEIRKREIIENELKVASQIQKSFLPETWPKEPGLSLAFFMKPAKAIGGDLYAFVRLAEKHLGVMVGDVSGKGTPAALFMSKVVSEFKFAAKLKEDPAVVLTDLNNSLSSDSTGGLFVTLSYAIFDVENKRLLLSNGGHLPLVCVDAQQKDFLLNAEEGMPLGVMEGVDFTVLERKLSAGEVYAFYTDGVTEARNKKGQEYGVERLQKKIHELRGEEAADILQKTLLDLTHFIGKADQHDDITLIIVKVDD